MIVSLQSHNQILFESLQKVTLAADMITACFILETYSCKLWFYKNNLKTFKVLFDGLNGVYSPKKSAVNRHR